MTEEIGDENLKDFYENEIAGLIESIKRGEQEIIDLKKELASARADLDAKDLFIRSQSNLIEELKAQNINRSIGDAKDDKCELAGGHEQ